MQKGLLFSTFCGILVRQNDIIAEIFGMEKQK
jgi:hypothetical protein